MVPGTSAQKGVQNGPKMTPFGPLFGPFWASWPDGLERALLEPLKWSQDLEVLSGGLQKGSKWALFRPFPRVPGSWGPGPRNGLLTSLLEAQNGPKWPFLGLLDKGPRRASRQPGSRVPGPQIPPYYAVEAQILDPGTLDPGYRGLVLPLRCMEESGPWIPPCTVVESLIEDLGLHYGVWRNQDPGFLHVP